MAYVTRLGSLASYEKGGVEVIVTLPLQEA